MAAHFPGLVQVLIKYADWRYVEYCSGLKYSL
jgi:hypothetical protein